jgi:hypothetical protein
LIPDRPFWIPAVAQGPHGMVKNLNPFWTKKFGSIPGGMKYIAAAMPEVDPDRETAGAIF